MMSTLSVKIDVLMNDSNPMHLFVFPCSQTKVLFNLETTGMRQAEPASSAKIDLLVREEPSSRPTAAGSSFLNPHGRDRAPHAITCDFVVAADGAGSTLRSWSGLGLSGRRGLGYLVNIHFRCNGLARLLQHDSLRRPGMLYFVYNEACEREGENIPPSCLANLGKNLRLTYLLLAKLTWLA